MLLIRKAPVFSERIESICTRCLLRLSPRYASTSSERFPRRHRDGSELWPRHLRKKVAGREWFSSNFPVDLRRAGLPPAFFNGARQSVRAAKTAALAIHSPAIKFEVDENSTSTQRTTPTTPTPAASTTPTDLSADPTLIPPDASSRLSTISTNLPTTSFRRLLTTCLALSKPRLSFLMVLTTTTAYSLFPVPAALLSSATVSSSLSTVTLVFLTTGTALCSASANAFNMLLEPQHDAKMSRTKNRPIVRGLIGRGGALMFACIVGTLGIGGLWFGVNPTVAFLGGLTILIYAGLYTPLKRITVLNTWVGAVVGSIPPLMGWAAASGQYAVGEGGWQELLLGSENIGGWLLSGLLFAWQFPHFNALSWTIREEYKNAGYRMLSWTNPRMNGRVAFRYALLLIPICFGLTWSGVTDRGFMITSSVINIWVVREAWKFWRLEGQKGSARGLFWASVWHLPILMALAMAHKQGLWQGIWNAITGEAKDDEDVDEEFAHDQTLRTKVTSSLDCLQH